MLLPALLLSLLAPVAPPADAVLAPLSRGELKGARPALCVVDVQSGERLYALRADEPQAPASNLKLLTTAAALSLLGAEHAFSTRLAGTAAPDAQGVLAGDLVVLGGADPCLRADLLEHEGVAEPAGLLADLLVAHGVRRVTGRLVLDDGLLDREWLSADWKPGDIGHDYAAPVGALSLHGNCLEVEVAGGAVARLATLADGYRVENRLASASSSGAYEVGISRPDASGLLVARGVIGRGVGPQRVRVPVVDPAELFGRCLAASLRERGIALDGGLCVEAGAAARAPHALGTLQSPLVNAVLLANKESDNGLADHLFKYLGALHGGAGSFDGGERAVLAWLRTAVATPVEGVVLRDGSGLSGKDRVSARLLTDVLRHMALRGDAAGNAFLRSLPVAGLDGSLKARLGDEPLRGAVRAKTGYIAGVSCLSGYARSASGRLLAFSVLINDFDPRQTNAQMKAIQDDICRALVASS
jgi:D-alanyl-D-alanine carboxypeptidase/D-alanyl-D-alanine-endopeptidase (penicillin-binding protein 4)